ncbi:MAG TPA: cytochrome c oxidase subunit II [Beijerinckiaceae bacterium]
MLAAAPLAGCEEWQSALHPAGPKAGAAADLFWLFTWICAAVWILVLLAMLVALFRRRSARADPLARDPAVERRSTIVVAACVAATSVVLVGLTALSYAGQRALFGPAQPDVVIQLIGRQWWWEARYEDDQPSRAFTTANEIHIPVGALVRLKLESADVIHSFWAPNLAGKLDLVPGRQNTLDFQADRPGVYRAQCAEFCGYQHAHMGLHVVAEPREAFDAWRARQIAAREPPEDAERREGERIFLSKPCASCHTVRGSGAGGRIGPDLTHIGGRRYLAAGLLPTNVGSLAAWITDPQSLKPGAHMPAVDLQPHEVQPLARYLEGLK